MKSVEIKRIGAGSVFKFNFVVGVVVGLIACIVMLIAGASLRSIGMQLGTFGQSTIGPMQVGIMVAGVIIGSLGYGLILGISGAFGAWIYNLFAAAAGGIVVKLKE